MTSYNNRPISALAKALRLGGFLGVKKIPASVPIGVYLHLPEYVD
jgi:hypothetical protein